jgi:hypothetical protein
VSWDCVLHTGTGTQSNAFTGGLDFLLVRSERMARGLPLWVICGETSTQVETVFFRFNSGGL